MEIIEFNPQEEDLHVSCPLGGPIFDTTSVGPLTCVGEFEYSIVHELKSLEAEIWADSTPAVEDDLSVDELKVFTEEELVDKALKEAFKDDEPMENSQVSEHHSSGITNDLVISGNEIVCLETAVKENSTSESCESLSTSLVEACNKDHSAARKDSRKGEKEVLQQDSGKVKKRGRKFDRNCRAAELESSYIEKVKELAKVKQKQDEDKAAARLYSFNGCAIIEGQVTAADKIEKMKSLKIESMRSLRFITSPLKAKSSSADDYVPVNYPEVVLSIEIYHNIKVHRKTQEFLVLGRQLLTDLRDNIYCLTDQLMQKAERHDPSGYFLIEDVFCNDLRDPSAIKYSEPIFDWIRNCKDEALEKWESIMTAGELQRKQVPSPRSETIPPLPNFKAVDMHKTRFLDLRFRLGSGYLYCHQGDCKHTIIIRDMRLIHPEDVQNRAAYPILMFQNRHVRQKCSVCKIKSATKVTVDDKWSPENPSYFCENCYFLLHYKEDGSLLYDEFTVYDYYHD